MMGEMLEIRQLQFFVSCAVMGSFSKAADILFTTQSNVSRIIKDMEARLGVQLFFRHSHGISLTNDGILLLQTAHKILEYEYQIANMFELKALQKIRISLNSSATIIRFILNYCLNNDSIEKLELYECSTTMVLNNIKEGKSDLGIVFIMESRFEEFKNTIKNRNFQYEIIEFAPLKLYVKQNSPLGKNKYIRISQLARERFVTTYMDDYFSIESSLASMYPELKSVFSRSFDTDSHFFLDLCIDKGYCNINTRPIVPQNAIPKFISIPIQPDIDCYTVCIYRQEKLRWINIFIEELKTSLTEYYE